MWFVCGFLRGKKIKRSLGVGGFGMRILKYQGPVSSPRTDRGVRRDEEKDDSWRVPSQILKGDHVFLIDDFSCVYFFFEHSIESSLSPSSSSSSSSLFS